MLAGTLFLMFLPAKAPKNINKQVVFSDRAVVASDKPQLVTAPEEVVESPPQSEPVAAEQPPAATVPTVAPSGDKYDWMRQAGINPADYGAVDFIISHESSWNPNATEPTTGAHGLPQALPYTKTGCGWDDPVCQLQWATSYATTRYGGWWGAYTHWVANRWW